MTTPKKSPDRQYPPLFEKIIPLALILIALAILILIGIAVSVALGWFGRSSGFTLLSGEAYVLVDKLVTVLFCRFELCFCGAGLSAFFA
ncbi:MAG: hypothetical protein ACOY16_02250 [Chloroflexota bacterium]